MLKYKLTHDDKDIDLSFEEFKNVYFANRNENLLILVLYKNSIDYPNCYVLRIFDVSNPLLYIYKSNDLTSISKLTQELNVATFSTFPQDDPNIISTYI